MRKVRCGWCQKSVNDKPFFGTLHICLSPEDRRAVDLERQQVALQMQATRNEPPNLGWLLPLQVKDLASQNRDEIPTR